MNEINFVDQTIRDSQQSLWGFMMSTDMILPIAPLMHQVGYKTIATVGGRGTIVGLRERHENPFERLERLVQAMPKTPLRSSANPPLGLSSFDVEPLAANDLWINRAVAHGIRSFWVVDYQKNMERFSHTVQVIKAQGAEVVPSLVYTLSPVHTDELWEQKTRLIADTPGVDVIEIEDTGGVLTPERARTFIPAVLRGSKGIPVEFHEHCTTGLAPICYLEAIKLGIKTVHTSVPPLANGVALPNVFNIIKNFRHMGCSVNLDEEALKAISDHFTKVAEEQGLPRGVPAEYDLFYYDHQVPGGMQGTMRNQLAELGQEHRLEEVLEDVALIRQEFGYPVMGTPYSQFVGAQALFNVTSGERYKIVPDEVIKYMVGLYGEPDGPVDQNVKDKIVSSPKAKKWLNWKIPEVTIEDLRRIEPGLSDDELLIRLFNPRGEFKDKLDRLYGKR